VIGFVKVHVHMLGIFAATFWQCLLWYRVFHVSASDCVFREANLNLTIFLYIAVVTGVVVRNAVMLLR